MGYEKNNCGYQQTREIWTNEAGQYHREDGPAVVYQDTGTGVVTYEGHYVNGKHHRVGGPARIWRDPETGVVEVQESWENDVLLDSWPPIQKSS